MQKEIEVTGCIAGIRYYLPNKEADYPKLAKRVPEGSYVRLQVVPPGEKYVGAVRVLDSEGNEIGNLGKSDRQFFKLDIPEGGELEVKVIKHAFEHNTIVVWHINQNGFEETHPYELDNKYDEPFISFCKVDKELELLTKTMLTLVKKYTDCDSIPEAEMKHFCTIGRKYAQVCGESIDGDTLFSRAEIKTRLGKISKRHEDLRPIYSDIYEINKDISKSDFQTQVYHNQWNRVCEKAVQKDDNGKNFIDEYVENLKFSNCLVGDKQLTEDVIMKEIERLTKLLSDASKNKYQTFIKEPSKMAEHLYSWAFSLKSIYLFFTWRIKLNHMYSLLGVETDQNVEEEEEMFRYIHNAVTNIDVRKEINERVKNIVKNLTNVNDICTQLKVLEKEKLITMSSEIKKVQAELVRMGMPPEGTRGFSYKNFAKVYKEDFL